MKNPLTLPGIEPATFRFVAQHLNHCATAVPISVVLQGNVVPLQAIMAYKVKWSTASLVLTLSTTSIRMVSFMLCLIYHRGNIHRRPLIRGMGGLRGWSGRFEEEKNLFSPTIKCWDGSQELRWFPRFQIATTCFSCSPPDLNLVLTNFMLCIHVK
jgi:hypothetical protein